MTATPRTTPCSPPAPAPVSTSKGKEGKGKFVFFDKAKMCWNCWNTKKVKLDSCPDAPGHGAIWVAFGIVKNKAGKFTYVPDKNVCKMM